MTNGHRLGWPVGAWERVTLTAQHRPITRCLRALIAVTVVSVATCFLGVGTARATTVLSQNWESGLGGWTAADTSATLDDNNPTWQVVNPQNLVMDEGINPPLVTLPDP